MHSYAERETEDEARTDRGTAAVPERKGRSATAGGLPLRLRSGLEAASGFAMDDVRVHRNSAEPAKLGAHAFARGAEIHLAPGQERHLAHEAWHVVQQKQGRVAGAGRDMGNGFSDDPSLEAEADRMAGPASSPVRPRDALRRATPSAATAQPKKAKKENKGAALTYDAVKALVKANNHSGQSAELIIAQAYKESRFHPDAKNPRSSATGLLGITKVAVTEVNRLNKTDYKHSAMTTAATNIDVGTRYLKICIDRKGSLAAGLNYYGTGSGYSTAILAAEAALKADASDPAATLLKTIGKP